MATIITMIHGHSISRQDAGRSCSALGSFQLLAKGTRLLLWMTSSIFSVVVVLMAMIWGILLRSKLLVSLIGGIKAE